MRDLHTHTTFSDGDCTPEQMVIAAIEMGLEAIGFSDHSYTFFDESYCLQKENIDKYISEIALLKEKYKGKIEILCGIEQDMYSTAPTDRFDYVIGSAHYIKLNGEYVPVDENTEITQNTVKNYFGGDAYAYAEQYYRTVAKVIEYTNADIIGHFDLIARYNGQLSLFDEHSPRYRAAWKTAADKLLKTGVPFEINTGALFKGYRAEPYPISEIQQYISENGGKFIYSSDSHNTTSLCYNFK